MRLALSVGVRTATGRAGSFTPAVAAVDALDAGTACVYAYGRTRALIAPRSAPWFWDRPGLSQRAPTHTSAHLRRFPRVGASAGRAGAPPACAVVVTPRARAHRMFARKKEITRARAARKIQETLPRHRRGSGLRARARAKAAPHCAARRPIEQLPAPRARHSPLSSGDLAVCMHMMRWAGCSAAGCSREHAVRLGSSAGHAGRAGRVQAAGVGGRAADFFFVLSAVPPETPRGH